MKKIFFYILMFNYSACALQPVKDATRIFISALNSYKNNPSDLNAQALVTEYDSAKNSDKFRRIFDERLKRDNLTISNLRMQASVLPAGQESPTAKTADRLAAPTIKKGDSVTSAPARAPLLVPEPLPVSMPSPATAAPQQIAQQTLPTESIPAAPIPVALTVPTQAPMPQITVATRPTPIKTPPTPSGPSTTISMPPAIITPMPFIASVTENKPNSSPKQTTQAEPQEAAPTEPAAQEKNPQEFSKQQSLLFEPTDELIQAYKASDLEKLKKDPELGKLANLIAQNADDIQELVRKQLQAEQEMAETIDALEEDEEAIEEIINPSAANPSGNLKASISNQQEITTLLRTLTSRRALKNQKILWIAKLEKDMAAFEIKKTQKLIDLKNAELELTGNLMKKLTDPLAKVTVTATKFDPSEMLKKLTDTVSQFEKQGNMGELARAKSRLESFKYMLENFNTIQQEIPAAQAHEAAIKQASNKIAALQTDLQKLQAQAEKSTLQQKSASQIIKNVIEQERSSFSNLYKKSLANELNKFAEHLTIEPGEFLEGAFTMEMPKNYTNGVLENMRQAEAAQQTAGTKFKAQPIAKFTVPRAVTQGAKITPVTADALNSLNRALGYVKRVVK